MLLNVKVNLFDSSLVYNAHILSVCFIIERAMLKTLHVLIFLCSTVFVKAVGSYSCNFFVLFESFRSVYYVSQGQGKNALTSKITFSFVSKKLYCMLRCL